DVAAADAAYHEATELLRQLAAEWASLLPVLSAQLTVLAERRHAAGDGAAALALADDAVGVARGSDVVGKHLAYALGIRAWLLHTLDRTEEAIAASREQLAVLRRDPAVAGESLLEPLRRIAAISGQLH